MLLELGFFMGTPFLEAFLLDDGTDVFGDS